MRAWITKEDLTGCAWEWRARRKADVHGGAETDSVDEDSIVAFDKRLAEDIAAVHAALLAAKPRISAREERPPALTAEQVAAIETEVTDVVGRRRREGRARYLYWLLCRLGRDGRLTFTLPAQPRDRAPRALAFDPLDPHLPSFTVFRGWQRALASRALDVRGAAPSAGDKHPRDEGEWCALAVLLAFGGICGASAWRRITLLRREDWSPTENKLWLRDAAGDRTFALTLHPVQALAFAAHLRAEATDGIGEPLFTSANTRSGRRRFARWLARTLTPENKDEAVGARSETLAQLSAGAQRWMLELYPVFLVSVFADRYAAVASVIESPAGKTERAGVHDNGDTGRDYTGVRRALHEKLLLALNNDDGLFSRRNVAHLREGWSEILLPPAARPAEGDTAAVRWWNLFLLVEALLGRLDEESTNRYNTFAGWWYSGCAVLDALGGRPAWALNADERSALAADVRHSVVRTIGQHLYRMRSVAHKHGLCAPPEGKPPRMRAKKSASRPRVAPTPEQIERVAHFLIKQEARGRNIRNVGARTLLLYMDLLALGLRKSEALAARIVDVDVERDDADAGAVPACTDLIVNGRKTPAAKRRVPLDLHPHRASAARVVRFAGESARSLNTRVKMLFAVSGVTYRLRVRRRVDKGAVAVRQLDRALAEAFEICGFHPVTPHEMRHASITSWLARKDAVPELIAKFHGQVDLSTTFEHYAHGLAAIQERDLTEHLRQEESRVWVALPDAVSILGVTKALLYKRYAEAGEWVWNAKSTVAPPAGIMLERRGHPRYVDARSLNDDLVRHRLFVGVKRRARARRDAGGGGIKQRV